MERFGLSNSATNELTPCSALIPNGFNGTHFTSDWFGGTAFDVQAPEKSRCGKLRYQWKPQHGVYEARNSTISRELGCSGLYIESNYRAFYHVPADSFFRAGNILFR